MDNLAEVSKEGYGSKWALLLMMMMMMIKAFSRRTEANHHTPGRLANLPRGHRTSYLRIQNRLVKRNSMKFLI
jgi:hypothetical protein